MAGLLNANTERRMELTETSGTPASWMPSFAQADQGLFWLPHLPCPYDIDCPQLDALSLGATKPYCSLG